MRRSTFTLIEMLVVICILLILMGLGAAGVNKVLQNNAKKSTKLAVRGLAAAVEMYRDRYGTYPQLATGAFAYADSMRNDNGLAASSSSKYFIDYTALELTQKNTLYVEDYWGNYLRYVYNSTDNTFYIYSLGPEGKNNTLSTDTGAPLNSSSASTVGPTYAAPTAAVPSDDISSAGP